MPQYRVRHLSGLLLGWLTLFSPADAAAAPPEPSPVRATLRADWSNPNTSLWDGVIRLSAGRVESVRSLELRAGQVCIQPATGEQEIRFRTEGPASWCGLEFVVEVPPRATLELELDGHRLQTPLEELLKGLMARMAWDGSARLRRDPADILQVKLNRSHLIFTPGEPVKLDLTLNLLTPEPCVVNTHLQYALRSTHDGKPLLTERDKLAVQTNVAEPQSHRTMTIRTPISEGAFDLVVRAEPDGMQPVERVVQFVVLDPNAKTSPTSSELVTRLVEEIDPSQPNTGERWYLTRRLKAHTTRLGQFLWSSVRHPFTAPVRAKESPILMCRLNAENPGRAHLLNIEYEDSGDLLLAASISERDPDGRWLQLPVASGVRTAEKPSGIGVQDHQLVFWPQTKSPNVSLYVQAPTGIAAVKRIRLLELPQGLPTLDATDANPQRRLFGLYVDNPDVWASWGSARGVDPATRLPLDDWRTFLLSMNHLAEYARFAGYNCIQPTVVGQGGAMYPSALLDTNYRLDSGFVADSAPDPMRKDAVELLLRICQRNRLGVVPSIRLDGAIVALDRKVTEGGPQSSGLLLVSREGQVWDSPIASSIQPGRRYNPLNSDVQAAVLGVVRELVQRYGAHPAFEALALDLATQSHVVLPGLDWGYDDQTVADFVRETGIEAPSVAQDDSTRFAQRFQWLTTTTRDQWIAWRCRKLATFYEAVLAEVQQAKPTGRLIVDLTTLSGPGSEDPRDAARPSRTIEESLRARGIDLRNWSPPRDLVLLRPFAASASSPEGLQLNASRELDELMAHLPSRGSLCVHEPEVLHFSAGSGEKSAEDAADAIELAVSRPGRLNLRRYAQSLASSDCQAIFEGGPAVPLGCEQVQREFAAVFRSLPASAFQSVETLQPVIVRSHAGPRDTFVYMVNEASYAVQTNVSLNCPLQATLSNGSTGDKLDVHPAEHGLGTKLNLDPFQTICLKLSGPEASVVQCNVIVPQIAENGLKVRFDRLMLAQKIMGRDATRTLDGIPPNGDFESSAGDENIPAHWVAEGEPAACASDPAVFHGGERSLRLQGKSGSVVASDTFKPPEGRALSMNVWLRAAQPGQRIRWFLVGNRNGDRIYGCYADVRLSTNWEQKQFRALNLPEGQLTNVQIKFQLLDEGAVWIDEARVCALPISQDEKLAISKSIAAIYKAWKERRWSDFERLSDGYWATYLIESVEGAGQKDF